MHKGEFSCYYHVLPMQSSLYIPFFSSKEPTGSLVIYSSYSPFSASFSCYYPLPSRLCSSSGISPCGLCIYSFFIVRSMPISGIMAAFFHLRSSPQDSAALSYFYGCHYIYQCNAVAHSRHHQQCSGNLFHYHHHNFSTEIICTFLLHFFKLGLQFNSTLY